MDLKLHTGNQPELELASIDELREGDLVFCAKESTMQSLLESVGDLWRHAALIVDIDGEFHVLEVTGRHFIGVRRIEETVDFFDRVGTARPQVKDECRRAATNWARSHSLSPQLYPWDDVLMTAVLLVARRALPARGLQQLAGAMEELGHRASEATEFSRTCSAFVYEAFARGGSGCGLDVVVNPLAQHSSRIRTSRTGPRSLYRTLTMDSDDLQEVLDSTTLFELISNGDVAVPSTATRRIGNSKSHASAVQICRFATNVARLVQGYVNSYPSNDETGLVGRWVSPTDLWHSRSLSRHRQLVT